MLIFKLLFGYTHLFLREREVIHGKRNYDQMLHDIILVHFYRMKQQTYFLLLWLKRSDAAVVVSRRRRTFKFRDIFQL